MIIRNMIDLEKGEIGLRANKSNQNPRGNEINHVIRFLKDHPEIKTIHFFQSCITKELAEKLATIETIKRINFFAHSHVLFDFYKTSDPVLVANFERKSGNEAKVPSLTRLSLFKVKNLPQLDRSLLPKDLREKLTQP